MKKERPCFHIAAHAINPDSEVINANPVYHISGENQSPRCFRRYCQKSRRRRAFQCLTVYPTFYPSRRFQAKFEPPTPITSRKTGQKKRTVHRLPKKMPGRFRSQEKGVTVRRKNGHAPGKIPPVHLSRID